MTPRATRRRHRGQLGLTLIEMLVTIAILGAAIVGIAASFANIERSAATTSDQSALQVTMRNVTDYLRSGSIAYSWCAPVAGTYTIPNAIPGVSVLKTAPTVTLTKTQTSDFAGVVAPPVYECSTGKPVTLQGVVTTCPSTYCDWGVQRLTVTLTSTTGRKLSRVVFKSSP